MKDLMESKFYREAVEKGELKKARESILRILKARFGKKRKEISNKLSFLEDVESLDKLVDLAATCKDLNDFMSQM